MCVSEMRGMCGMAQACATIRAASSRWSPRAAPPSTPTSWTRVRHCLPSSSFFVLSFVLSSLFFANNPLAHLPFRTHRDTAAGFVVPEILYRVRQRDDLSYLYYDLLKIVNNMPVDWRGTKVRSRKPLARPPLSRHSPTHQLTSPHLTSPGFPGPDGSLEGSGHDRVARGRRALPVRGRRARHS